MKKFIALLLSTIVAVSLFGCSDSDTSEKVELQEEWEMEELCEVIQNIQSDYDVKTDNMSEDKIKEKKDKIIRKIFHKYGLEPEMELTVRGEIDSNTGYSNIIYLAADSSGETDLDKELRIEIKEDDSAFFIEEGKKITVKGVLSGVPSLTLKDCKIVSPKDHIPDFIENTEDIYYELSDKAGISDEIIVSGYVYAVFENPELTYDRSEEDENYLYFLDNSQYLVLICDEYGNNCIQWFASDIDDNVGKLRSGQKISVKTMGLMKAYGGRNDGLGYIMVDDGYYLYDTDFSETFPREQQ